MKDQAPRLWGIHAGRTGDADSLFLQKNVIALGWNKIGDLSRLKGGREDLKVAVERAYPEKKPGGVAGSAGQLFRFANEMKNGDLVLYPSKQDRLVHVGRVEGPYRHDPASEPGYPHQRPVKWLTAIPRTRLSQGALYEIGSALSLFQVKNHADEYRALVSGKPAPLAVTADASVAVVADEIVQSTRDFVLKRLSQELKGHPLTEFVAHLLGTMGYKTRVSPEGPDGGVDIIAHRDELGFEPPLIKVQVKSGDATIGDPVVSALSGKVAEKEFGLIVTLGTFTN